MNDNKAYFKLLLTAHPLQKRALLLSSNNEQLDLISEILHNILNTLPLEAAQKRQLNRRKYLSEIANIKRSHKYRRDRVKKFKCKLLKLLEDHSEQLGELLKTTSAH